MLHTYFCLQLHCSYLYIECFWAILPTMKLRVSIFISDIFTVCINGSKNNNDIKLPLNHHYPTIGNIYWLVYFFILLVISTMRNYDVSKFYMLIVIRIMWHTASSTAYEYVFNFLKRS